MDGLKPLMDHFQRMALYNTRANVILYEACARLPHEALVEPRPAFFGSILGALNHILVGDRIWMARFEGDMAPSTGLDVMLYDTLPALQAARTVEDSRIAAFTKALNSGFLESTCTYMNNQGRTLTDPNAVLLAHLFNHQTHHRGQVHGLLSQTEVPPPSLDMHRILNP